MGVVYSREVPRYNGVKINIQAHSAEGNPMTLAMFE